MTSCKCRFDTVLVELVPVLRLDFNGETHIHITEQEHIISGRWCDKHKLKLFDKKS